MKNKLTLDWIEYIVDLDLFRKLFSQVEEQEPLEEDKYKKIREVVERWRSTLAIKWDKKELMSYKDWRIVFDEIERVDMIDELHFEECTLWDLKENDVFVIKTRIYIIVKESDRYFIVNYLDDDIISREWFSKNDTPVIKILRH